MTSNGSRRSVPLPRGWARIRKACLERDHYQCIWVVEAWDAGGNVLGIIDGFTMVSIAAHVRICGVPATDSDHIGDPSDHSLENLRSLCSTHHNRRTALQANRARWQRDRLRPKARPVPKHPGLIQKGE